MTLKERRAQVEELRRPRKAGVLVALPDGKVLSHKSSDKAAETFLQGTPERRSAAVAAVAAPSNLRVAPHDWFGFKVEWGDVKWDNPAGSKSLHMALYSASDNKLVKQWCDSYTADPTEWRPTMQWGVDDPTILTLGVGYYMKIAVSNDVGTNSDPNGWGCATGWSSEAKSPTIVAQGPATYIDDSETYGCGCLDTTGRMPFQGYLGDPVNTATGAQAESAVDARVAAPGTTFAMRRTYSSNNTYSGMLGTGWSTAYDAHLQVSSSKVVYVADSGTRVTYAKDATSGAYTASSLGVTATLTGSATAGFTLTSSAHETLTFDGAGKLTGWKDAGGVGLSFAYSGGYLTSVTDAAGHVIKLTVDPSSHLLQTINLPGGQNVKYTYSGGLLTSVTGTDGGVFTYGYDDGLLTSITDPAGHKVMQAAYNSSGRVTQQTDADGKTTTFSRATAETDYQDADGGIWTDLYNGSVLRNRIDPLGNVTSYQYDSKLRLTDVTDPSGTHTTMTYNGVGDLLSRAAGGVTQTWTYDSSHNVTSYTNGRGAKTTYTYDTAQRLTAADGPAGKTTFTYNTAGQTATTTSPRGKVTAFGYDDKGNLTSRATPSGAKTTYTYDAAGRMLATTDPRGNASGADPAKYTTTYAYNAAGQLTKVTDPTGSVTTYAYDANGNQTKVTDAADGASVYTYDKFNRVTSATAPDGSVESTGYDAAGNVVAVTDPTGAKTTYGYDKANRLVSTTSPRGNAAGADPAKYTTTYGYDHDGNHTTTVDPTGAVTATRYDTLNRPVQVTDALSHTTKTTYDGNGNVATVTDGRGKVTAYTYTPADLLETVKDPLGKVTTFGYDADGNRTSSTTPLGRKHTWTYDADGRLKSETDPRGNVSGADPASYTTTYGYDLDGNRTTVTDPLGNTQSEQYDPTGRLTLSEDGAHHKTLIDYDALGRVKTVTAADGGVTSYTYDQAGNVHTRVDDHKHTTTYSYDAAHHLTSVTDPLSQTVKYSYDQDGNQQKATNARGVTATTAFDARGLPTGISHTDDTPSTTTTYDAVGNRKTVTDASGTRTFAYDENNRVIGITAPGKNTGFSYMYDDAGHMTSRTYPDGRATTYTYTSDGNRDSSTTDGVKTTYGYNASAQLTRTTLPSTNGYVETRAHDAAGRLTDISSAKGNATLTSTHVAYDANGQPERIDDVRGTTATSHYYSYDATGRLLTDCTSSTKADTCPSGSPTTAFTYDKVGNRLTQTEDGKTTSYSYNDADELTQSTTGTSKTAYDYDADGNQTASGANKFTYDAANRLTSATVGSATYGYTYDADGNRVAASKNGSTLRTMTWDLNNKLPLLATENGTAGSLIADYQYNPVEQIQGETTGAGTFYHHHDLLGSVTNITDANGALQRSYDYTAFGEVTQTDVATNPPTNRFTYTGEYKEPTTNAAGYYLRARNYDPDTGRLTTRDPYAPSEDTPYIQPYAYVENAPTSRTDPSGMCSVTTQLKDVFTGNWGWNNNCAKEDRETAAKPPAVQAAKNLSDTTTRSLINDSGQASLGFLDGLTFGTFSHLSGAQVTCPSAYNMGLYASMVPFPVTGGRRLALEGAEYATASVWSRIAATQPAYPSTLVPRSFNLMTATGRQIWVHPNATKHIAEEIMHNSFSRHLKTEEMLVGLVRSVDDATRQGIQYGRRVLSHGWELIIVPGKTVLDNPVLKHARRLG